MISLEQILLNAKKNVTKPQIDKAIATSMTMSVGITLPFNIVIGFEIYARIINAQMQWQIVSFAIIATIIVLAMVTLWRPHMNK